MRTAWLLLVACSCAAGQMMSIPARGRPVPPPTGTDSIAGTVVNEITREPMKKVTVSLSDGGVLFLSAVTDPYGHFAFTDLPEGTYVLQTQQVSFFSDSPLMSRSLHLGPEEHVTDVTLPVSPPASVSGQVVDENGAPMGRCNVMLFAFERQNGRLEPAWRGSAETGASGTYEIDKVSPGKYYLIARCYDRIPMPHAFMDRNSPDIPMMCYAPRLYPDSSAIEGARQLAIKTGMNLSGIDFRMAPVEGVPVKVRLRGEEIADTQVILQGKDPLGAFAAQERARLDPKSGMFDFTAVAPGSYDVIATIAAGRSGYYGTASVNVGSGPPEPIDLTLAPLATISGSVRFEGDSKGSVRNFDLNLAALDKQLVQRPTHAYTNEKGEFTITGVPPGRWALFLSGQGYIKSIRINDHDATPDALDVPAGAPSVNMQIVVGTAWASADGSITGDYKQGDKISGVLWRVQTDGPFRVNDRSFLVDQEGHFKIQNVAPGKYRACAAVTSQPDSLQKPDVREKIESHCQEVEFQEGEHATIQVPLISREDFDRLTTDRDTP